MSAAHTERSDSEARTLKLGRDLIVRWVGLLKAVGFYQNDNSALRAVSEEIRSTTLEILDGGVELDLTVRQDSIFIAGQRIREGAVASSAYQRLIAVLAAASVSSLRIDEEVNAEELETLARLIMDVARGNLRSEDLPNELAIRGATHVEVCCENEEEQAPDLVDSQQVAKRIYLRSIGVVKALFHEERSSSRIDSRRVKRVVQEMIESLDLNPDYLLNLTSLKNYDEYTFNHSVNVSVMAIALGRHIGLTRRQLYGVGQAGMLHDLGKLCVPRQILNKSGRLTPDELRIIRGHPVDGFLTIGRQLGVSRETIPVALAAYEHHVNEDQTGYPEAATERPKALLSRIVSVADRYDAMTSARVYRNEPISPPKALAIMYGTQGAHHDPAILHYFMNLMGIYPLGTTVLLSDGCIGVVVGGTADAALRHLPPVQLVLDSDGRPAPNEVVDLAAGAKDDEPLKIDQVLDASDYGIEVMDYIL